jgi:hypothetical protein
MTPTGIDTGVALDALDTGFALLFIGTFVVGLAYIAFYTLRKLLDV